jgi:hypothetical protein
MLRLGFCISSTPHCMSIILDRAVVLGSAEIIEKSHKWWDGGAKPAGLKTVGVFGCLGTEARDVLVFEAESHDDIREMVNFWPDTTDFEVHPAVDLAANFRQQGMKVA